MIAEPVTGSATVCTRPHDRWLPLARAAWIAVVLLTVALYVVGAPVLLAQLQSPCAGVGCYRWQPSPAMIQRPPFGLSPRSYAVFYLVLETIFVLGFCAVAVVLVRRRADEPMALFGAIALVAFGGNVFTDTSAALETTGTVWSWLARMMACLGSALLFIFFYLFPDGRFIPRWTRGVAALWIAVTVLGYFAPPRPSLDATNATGSTLFPLLALGFFVSVIVAQVVRYRQVSTPAQRQQTKWVVSGFITAIAGILANILLLTPLASRHDGAIVYQLIGITSFGTCLLLIPLSIGVAILRYRLWDIDVFINRALVYGALTACVVVVYVLVVVASAALFRTRGNPAIALIATGFIAILFQPLRARLQRGVNRLMYGERDDPYAVISRLGQRLEATLAPGAVLPTVCQTVREALNLPYAAVALNQDDGLAIVATSGIPVADPLRLPLVYQNDLAGELLLAPRAPGEGFSPADRRLLDALGRQAGMAAHAVRLTDDLQRSRERLVRTREEERRRLRRDLHDGLGPMLGSLTLKLSVADDLLDHDPIAAHALLRGLKTETQTAIADIRRLVYALRPPALDDLGLVAALREEAAQYGQSGLDVMIEGPERLPPLSAAVEVAAYRITQEALTNAVRHANARRCVIHLMLDEAAGVLDLEIRDDGCGLPATRGRGVGLASMRERAAELSGTCVVESLPAGGTRVRALLPYRGLAEVSDRRHGSEVAPIAMAQEE